MKLVRFNNPAFQFFNEDFNNIFKNLDTMYPSKHQHNIAFNNIPAVNVKENDGAFEIEVAAPGLKKEDFKLSLHENRLSISTKKEQSSEEKTEQYTRQEFNYSSFQRTFTLPKSVDGEKIEATYSDGILHVNLPKKEEIKPAVKEIVVA
ncbi:Hsp20/alpha crystallin family protein [Arcicella rigui]|uniref:Hsp20/alpha crystallin family protein n=1 Tax=Arcicella rigui TaxID=797020 RepID=A0ABU5QFM3_9BACT|nr:Hsp20/alpha crystallin family protein [Arcicella rigui]MEA5141337.1 Hsp20/alpha crystallin family protein [Arcicella rigui]